MSSEVKRTPAQNILNTINNQRIRNEGLKPLKTLSQTKRWDVINGAYDQTIFEIGEKNVSSRLRDSYNILYERRKGTIYQSDRSDAEDRDQNFSTKAFIAALEIPLTTSEVEIFHKNLVKFGETRRNAQRSSLVWRLRKGEIEEIDVIDGRVSVPDNSEYSYFNGLRVGSEFAGKIKTYAQERNTEKVVFESSVPVKLPSNSSNGLFSNIKSELGKIGSYFSLRAPVKKAA